MGQHCKFMAFLALVTLAAWAPGQADDMHIRAEAAWTRQAAMMQGEAAQAGSGNAAVYAILVNAGKQPDALLAATSHAARTVEIHESYQHMGMIMMRPVKKLAVPAGQSVTLKPGGYHLMLLDLQHNLQAGETISVTLQFQKAGKIPVTVNIR